MRYPTPSGIIAVSDYEAALRAETRLACLMLANNELGTVQPVAALTGVCGRLGVPVLTDAVQATGKIAIDVGELGVDFLILGGIKFHGPLGAAALWVRGGRELRPLLVGGGQERQRRSGTPDVPAIVGLGTACELADRELATRAVHLASLRDRFEAGLASIDGAVVHCVASERLPNTPHVAFRGVDASALVIRLDLRGYAVSTGAACSSGATQTSPTLAAIGLDTEEARGSLRVSFGMPNQLEEVDDLLEALGSEVAALGGGVPR